MGIVKFVAFVLTLALLPMTAHAAKGKGPTPKPDLALFCEGTYALCIKAPCVPVTNAKGTVTSVVCSCTVEEGWSMGPATCADRRVLKHGSTSHMMSTYSNYYNTEEQTLTCNTTNQQWANCYGAPCTSNNGEPNRAHCTCPVWTGEMKTLGGKCDKGNCNAMWSAATPAQNTFANNYFFEYMSKNHPKYPAKPPAKVCGAI